MPTSYQVLPVQFICGDWTIGLIVPGQADLYDGLNSEELKISHMS